MEVKKTIKWDGKLKGLHFEGNDLIDENGEVIDFLGGRDDLNRKLIRTVGDADERFEQDALRILRAIRFATNKDLDYYCSLNHSSISHTKFSLSSK